MRVLTAGMPSHTLIGSIERAGWGDTLIGADMRGLRAVLAALVRALPASAQGTATVAQVADRAGYSHRWTRRCLSVLEELGLIEAWERGGVVRGDPTPSYFRVSKRELAALGNLARRRYDEVFRKRAEETRARIARWRLLNTRRNQQKPRSVHVALTSPLPLNREEPGDPPPVNAPPVDHAAGIAAARAALRAGRKTG